MSDAIYLTTLGLFFGTFVVVFGMKYLSTAFAARARIASDKSWSELAERAVAAQTENQSALAAIRGDVAQLAASLAAVENILKQVE